MKVIIHRGANEIGGSCIEVRSGESRVILDMGMPLVGSDKKTRFNFQPYEKLAGSTLVKKGILPDIKGLYAWDKKSKPVDGVVISHAHQDHYGFLRFVRSDVCVYLTKSAHKLIDLTCMFSPTEANIEKHRHIRSGAAFRCGAFRIMPYLMDHSGFDAQGFVIEAGGKTLIYPGDFRDHGRKGKVLDYFLARAPRKADAILLEGSMLGRKDSKTPTENQLEKTIAVTLKATPGIALVHTSSQNIDRLVTLYRACVRSNRLFCVDFYTANVLKDLQEISDTKIPYPSKEYEQLRVFNPEYLRKRTIDAGNIKLIRRFSRFKITRTELANDQHRVLMLVRSSTLFDLTLMHKKKPLVDGTLLYSMWGGYREDSGTRKLLDWARDHDMTMDTDTFHTSGHANVTTLKKVVRVLKPQRIIPIHTFYPEQYRELYGDSVVELEDGEELKL